MVTQLKEGAEIGLSWVVLDYDDENAGANGYRSFNNLSESTDVHSDADRLRRFKLMPLEKPELQARWSFNIPDRKVREVHFHDASVGAVENWLWDFGDGNTSTEQHPIHKYEQGGLKYVVTLQVEGSGETSSLARIWEVSLP